MTARSSPWRASSRCPSVPGTAEFAIVVGDAYQRQGLAAELLDRLAARRRARGITRFRATMLSDNVAIQRLLERLAVGEVQILRGSVTEMEITLPEALDRGAATIRRPRSRSPPDRDRRA